ncbi:MAG TPA: DNRLRE domain-containing protein [bacterium]|nr:DNRLRE domain-containing protein [bacterium]
MRRFVSAAGVVCVLAGLVAAQSVEYPIPISETSERIAPNTVVFLTYPKYYKTVTGELAPVVTDLVVSGDPEWDFEVNRGIWRLRVRTDGTFRADHEGDAFTYRLEDIGIGGGAEFRSLDLGKANWEKYQVIGDTIRWSDVYPNIDLTVRYVHDTLKVDTIVKAPMMRDIRAKIANKELDGNNYLTARFTVLQAAVMAEARQGGEIRDLYAEPFTINEPLLFVRDNKVIHEVRPVEAYPLDAMGQRLAGARITLRTAQRWQLERNAPGIAEMSVILADLVNLPDGDLCIDPTTTFATGYTQDSLLDYNNQVANYGTNSSITWDNTNDRFVFGFDVSSMGSGKSINSATLMVYMVDANRYYDLETRAYRITEEWTEGDVSWEECIDYTDWTVPGGTFDSPEYQSPPVDFPGNDDFVWLEYDVTDAFKAHYYSAYPIYTFYKGFLVKPEESLSAGEFLTFITSENASTSVRPKLIVTYDHTQFGADAGAGLPGMGSRLAGVKEDNLNVTRLFGGISTAALPDYLDEAQSRGMKVVMCYGCGPVRSSTSEDPLQGIVGGLSGMWYTAGYSLNANGYRDYIMDRLSAVSDYIDGTIDHTIVAVELGNEEDAGFNTIIGGATYTVLKWPLSATQNSYASQPELTKLQYQGGVDFADYYRAARDAIKDEWPNLEIISGGSIVDEKVLAYPDWGGTDPELAGIGRFSRAFVCGFIDGVTAASSASHLPETIAIHGYTLTCGPEDYRDTGVRMNWNWRIDHLEDCCTRGSYEPDMAITEYGMQCGGAYTEQKQAIWYMRRALIDGTVQSVVNDWTWRYSLYFHHPWDTVGIYPWYSDSTTSRVIRKVGRTLHGESSGEPGLGSLGSGVWIQCATDPNFTDAEEDGEETMRCGWTSASNEKWGAVWRFDQNDTSGWWECDGDTRYFDVPLSEADPGNARAYRFTGTSSYSTTTFSAGDLLSAEEVGSVTRYTVPDTDENPVFLRFGQ